MPFITIDTNAKVKVSDEMLEEITDLTAKILNKPLKYITVKINTGKLMACGGSSANIGALIEFKSIGFGDIKPLLAQKLTEFAEVHFNAEAELVGIHFVDMPAANVAHGGNLLG